MESRSTIALNSELVARFSVLAQKKKVTRYFLANECVRAALRLCEEGGDIDEIYGSWKIMRLSREVGGFPLAPKELMANMVSKLFDSHKDWLLKTWYDEGVALGGILKLHFDDPSAMGPEVMRMFPSSSRRLEVQAMDNEDGKGYLVRIVGEFGKELALCLEQLIRGALSVFAMAPKVVKVSRNMIQMFFQAQEESR